MTARKLAVVPACADCAAKDAELAMARAENERLRDELAAAIRKLAGLRHPSRREWRVP